MNIDTSDLDPNCLCVDDVVHRVLKKYQKGKLNSLSRRSYEDDDEDD
nr:MAG TPA: hypothetical protein [Caudoviricetes sp.]